MQPWEDLIWPIPVSDTPILDFLRACNGRGWQYDKSGDGARRALDLHDKIYRPRWMLHARYDIRVINDPRGIISLNVVP